MSHTGGRIWKKRPQSDAVMVVKCYIPEGELNTQVRAVTARNESMK